MDIILGLVALGAVLYLVFRKKEATEQPVAEQVVAPYKVETPEPAPVVDLADIAIAQRPAPVVEEKAPAKAKKAKAPAKPKAPKATGEKKPKAPRKKKAAE